MFIIDNLQVNWKTIWEGCSEGLMNHPIYTVNKVNWLEDSNIKTGQNNEYDQEIPLSQIVDKPLAPRGRATQQSQDTRKTN